jgi:hypothetical protein
LAGPGYWNKRFKNPESEIKEMHIFFETYEGTRIDLEK